MADPTYQCLFCGEGISAGELDPCALVVVARIDRPRVDQKEQTFYCHLGCLQGKALVHPRTFYIADPGFATVGENEADARSGPAGGPAVEIIAEQVAALPWGDVALRGIRWRAEDAGMDLLVERPGEGESCLRCSWVSHVRSTLSFVGGPALTWDVEFACRPDGSWRVRFDFASRGELDLTCDEVVLVQTEPIQPAHGG